jgi:DNA-binding NarL/FixJ family response regulator
MLTASENEQDVTSALQASARGYILKGSSGPEVVATVRAIYRGEHYM